MDPAVSSAAAGGFSFFQSPEWSCRHERRCVLSICLLVFSVAAATEKEATLKVGAKSYAVSELLKRPKIEKISSSNPSA
jgi:hypothetical protein